MGPSFWDRVAGFYDLAERANGRAVRNMVYCVTTMIPKGASLLECAAGTGEISLAAAERAGQVVCTDQSLPMLDRARAKASDAGLTNISFFRRDLLHLPDGDETYDVVCAANVLHLLEDPAAAVAELWRVTAAGGTLILPTFLTEEANPLFRALVFFYRLAGFRPRRSFSKESYPAFFQSLNLPAGRYILAEGKLPVSVAAFCKI